MRHMESEIIVFLIILLEVPYLENNNSAEKAGFLYASLPLPLARNKENIETGTQKILDRDGNSVNPG